MKEKLYLFKIRFMDVKKETWRKFVVPSGKTLDRFRDVMQIAMG